MLMSLTHFVTIDASHCALLSVFFVSTASKVDVLTDNLSCDNRQHTNKGAVRDWLCCLPWNLSSMYSCQRFDNVSCDNRQHEQRGRERLVMLSSVEFILDIFVS
jgi:hypothetical protein